MEKTFGLYLILTDPIAGYESCARAAVACGVRWLQLRMKNAPPSTVLATAHTLRRITQGSATRLIINDSVEIAMEADADGVHLGQDDLSIAAARAHWKTRGKWFGLSTHSMEQMRAAVAQQADYIGIGPVFATPTKARHDPPLGIEQTARIAAACPVPSVAIGGIDAGNLPRLRAHGIANWCVVRAVNQAADPAAAIRQLQEKASSLVF